MNTYTHTNIHTYIYPSSGELCDLEDETMRLEVARGNGPVDALAKALKKALLPTYPTLEQLELIDYKVCMYVCMYVCKVCFLIPT